MPLVFRKVSQSLRRWSRPRSRSDCDLRLISLSTSLRLLLSSCPYQNTININAVTDKDADANN